MFFFLCNCWLELAGVVGEFGSPDRFLERTEKASMRFLNVVRFS
jgi:hypothetical protein